MKRKILLWAEFVIVPRLQFQNKYYQQKRSITERFFNLILMLSYEDLGRGDVVVLLHGFCEDKSLWKDFEEDLSEDYRVINIDLPGFGESPLLEEEVSMAWYADVLNDLLEELAIQKVTIIGHSLGGYIGLAFAEKFPKKLKGLGLIHSNVFADTEERIHIRNKTLIFLEKRGIKRFISSFVPPLFPIKTRKEMQGKIQEVIQMGNEVSTHTAMTVTCAMRDRPSYEKVLKKLVVPVLYVVGKEDTSVPYETSLAQIDIPQKAIIYTLEGVGHMGMLEKPEEVRKAINDLLSKVN
ncbi:MAG: alpha/beta hydrolase [Cytophagales bacterium]|nr:alpha/beta hydrolase [Cytophagales bacterium]